MKPISILLAVALAMAAFSGPAFGAPSMRNRLTAVSMQSNRPQLALGNLRSGRWHALQTVRRVPEITSVRGRVVKVQVPDGFRAVTLETKTARRGHPWAVIQTHLSDGRASEVSFTLRNPVPRGQLRVTAQRQTRLPSGFLEGRSNFPGSTSLATGNVPRFASGAVALDNVAQSRDAASRDVVESDIWKLSGDRLYFFNQYRGLQVIDVSQPDSPEVLGQLRLPAQGDQLYELPGGYVALLTRKWGFNGENGEIVVCDVRSGEPVVVARLPYVGSLRESRLVGSALYLATDQTLKDTANSWQQETVVIGFDLSDPSQPVERNSVAIPPAPGGNWSWAAAIWANERHLLVSNIQYTNGSYRSTVSILDIRDPLGRVRMLGSVAVPGMAGDKFKLGENGDTLTVISDDLRWGYDNGQWFSSRNTLLSNFNIAHPALPKALGTLSFGEGETTYATRMDGDRIYVVTAVQHDPLWIIDNADPAAPRIVSHLEVPGFSTYIEPLGDRLVTVGRLTGLNAAGVWQNRTAVSLYDVADPARPKLLSQLPVGGDWSNSEANWNEKAFTVLPGEGLIMLPFSENWGWWDGSGGGAVQLVDLKRDSLALRGVIRHGFTPRRSAVKGKTVLALSSRDLLSVDIADRDRPVVKSDVLLAWTVNRVWNLGRHVVQLDKGRSNYWWQSDGSTSASLTISPAENPDDITSSLDLGPAPCLAAEVRDGILYVVQGRDSTKGTPGPGSPAATLSIYDLASLPRIVRRGSAAVIGADELVASSNYQILWPTRETLVVAHRGSQWWPWYGYQIADIAVRADALPSTTVGRSALAASDRFVPWGYGGGKARLFAFNVSSPEAPVFLNETQLGKENAGNYSEAFADDGKVFVSRLRHAVYYPDPVLKAGTAAAVSDPEAGRNMLEVVDYADSGTPIILPPASLPGELRGVSRHGQILYTVGPAWGADGLPDYGRQVLHASAYDGKGVHLVDTLPLESGGGDLRLSGETLYVRQNDYVWQADGQSDDRSRIEAASLFDNGRLVVLGTRAIPAWVPWAIHRNVLVWTENGSLVVTEIDPSGRFLDVGSFPLNGSPVYDLSGGDGDLARGLWLPAGDYGVERVPFPGRGPPPLRTAIRRW